MIPDLLRFEPVPLRAQHNGWTPALQLRFILALARGAGPDEAARSLGMTRQSAYRLRKKPGAESFAAAWDRAQDFARTAAAAARSPAYGSGAIETILVPRHYRGRLVGFVQREDTAGAMRTLRQLDRIADRVGDSTDLREWSERFEAFEELVGSRSYSSDEIPRVNASSSSTPAPAPAALDGAPAASSPYARVRVREQE